MLLYFWSISTLVFLVGCVLFVVGGRATAISNSISMVSKTTATKSKKEVIGPKSWKLSLPTENTSGYLTGWFTPDIALLSLDVMTFFGTSSTDVQSLTLLRLFRSLRLLRLVRMMGRAHLLKEHLTGSEFMGALASATWEQCSVWFSLGQFQREKHHHPLYF